MILGYNLGVRTSAVLDKPPFAFRRLRKLVLFTDGRESTHSLARALASGMYPQLKELCLQNFWRKAEDLIELAEAFEGRSPCSTSLVTLEIDFDKYDGITNPDMDAFCRLVNEKALPLLRKLSIICGFDEEKHDDIFRRLLKARPDLKELAITCSSLGQSQLEILAEELKKGSLPNLTALSFDLTRTPIGFKKILLEALKERRKVIKRNVKLTITDD